MSEQTPDWVNNLRRKDVFHDRRVEYMVMALPDIDHMTFRVAGSDNGIYDLGPGFLYANCTPGPLKNPEKDWTQKTFDATTFEAFAEAQLCDFPAAVREQVYGMMVAVMTLAYERGYRDGSAIGVNEKVLRDTLERYLSAHKR